MAEVAAAVAALFVMVVLQGKPIVAGSELQPPVKPRTDASEYRRIRLDNGMDVLLVHDPETEKAAASVDVSV